MTLEELRDNLVRVRERIAAACARSGRAPTAVQILAVTKTQPGHVVGLAWQAGVRLFGENRVQEALAKYGPRPPEPGAATQERPGEDSSVGLGAETQARWPGIDLHLVGHLQRNKAQAAARLFGCVQSIDKVETAQALDRACGQAGRSVDVLLELNTSGESSKFGFAEEGPLLEAAGAIAGLSALRLRGLMTVGPLSDDSVRIGRAFARLCTLFERMRGGMPGFDVLSMGMSADFEIAVQEGATMVRLGTILFGPRD